MVHINKGFADAAVTTHAARITKKQHRYISWDEFQIENYIDPSLTKYFYELRNRKHYAIDAATATAPKDINFDSSKSIFINHRDPAHKHFAYTKNCAAYKINTNSLSYADTWKLHGLVGDKSKRLFDAGIFSFNTTKEKDNFAAFLYSKDGFRFISKVLTAVNIDSWIGADRYMPKVDWTRSWTVEEILKEYLYSVLGRKQSAIVMDGNGVGVKTPRERPKTIHEAGLIAREMFKK
jgi:hypothetical protein